MSKKAGMLCSADKLIGSDVKSAKTMNTTHRDTMSSDSQTGTMNRQSERQSDTMNSPYSDTDTADRMSRNTETIGTVEELIINDKDDAVCYVVLNADGQHYPVPWQAFEVKSAGYGTGMDSMTESATSVQREVSNYDRNAPESMTTTRDAAQGRPGMWKEPALYLNISREQLRQAPSIPSVSVQRLSDSQFKQQVESFYSQHTGKNLSMSSARRMQQTRSQQRTGTSDMQTSDRDMQTSQSDQENRTAQPDQMGGMTTANLFKTSEILGMNLQSTEDADLGSIQDLVIDSRQGHVAYGLVSFGGFMNIAEKTAAVPWTSLTIQMPQRLARIDATEDKLNQAILEDGDISRLMQPQFAQRIHDNFNVEPYWGVYGYVAPGSQDSQDTQSTQPDQSRRQQRQQQQQQSPESQQRRTPQNQY